MNYSSNLLLIIGNGFDRSLGLKTAYSDFFESEDYESIDKEYRLINHLNNAKRINKWIDLENEIKAYSAEIKRTSDRLGGGTYIDLDKEKEGLKALRNGLLSYLSKLDYSSINKESPAYKLFKRVCTTTNRRIVVLDFNYTKSIDILKSQIKHTGEFEHVKIHGDVESNNIIVGVEDEAEVYHNFIKKSYPHYFPGIDIDQFLDNAIGNIIFYGYSLGETDHSYFREFFSNLSEKRADRKFKSIDLYYYDDTAADALNDQLYLLTNNKVKDFKSLNSFKMKPVSEIK